MSGALTGGFGLMLFGTKLRSTKLQANNSNTVPFLHKAHAQHKLRLNVCCGWVWVDGCARIRVIGSAGLYETYPWCSQASVRLTSSCTLSPSSTPAGKHFAPPAHLPNWHMCNMYMCLPMYLHAHASACMTNKDGSQAGALARTIENVYI